MRKFLLIFLTQFCMGWAWSQLHTPKISPTSFTICQGQTVRLTSTISKGSFKFFATINGKDYFIDTIARSWSASRNEAIANGMDLWSINTSNENWDVYYSIPGAFKNKTNSVFWIGLFQDPAADATGGAAAGWKWVDGRLMETAAYKNWGFNEPNNIFQTTIPANVAGIGLNNTQPVWYDFPDQLPAGFEGYGIAEKDASPITYLWSNGERNQDIYPTPNATTTYTVTIQYDGVDVESSPAIVYVNFPAVSASFDLGSNSIYCLDWNEISFLNTSVISTPTAVQYKWEFGDGKTSTASSTTHRYSGLQTYNARLTATDGNGCSTAATKPVTILLTPLTPVISFQSGSNVFCAGDSAVLATFVNQPDPAASFNWYSNSIQIASGKSYTAKTSGLYSLIVSNSNGCLDTATVNIVANTLPEKPILSITPGFASSICSADSTNVTAAVAGTNLTYLWYKNPSTNPLLLASGSTFTYTIFPFTSTSLSVVEESYLVRVIDQNNCKSPLSDSIKITINPSPLVLLSSKTSPIICQGEFVQLDAQVNPAAPNLIWTRDFTSIAGTSTSIQAGITGVYRIKATNAAGCSRVSNPITVTVNPFPAIPAVALDPNVSSISADGTINVCAGFAASFSIAAVDNATYQWFKNGTAISNAKSIQYNATTSGIYRVGVTVLNCTSRSADQKVFVIPPAAGTLQSPSSNLICNGSTQTLSATGSVGYQWYYNTAAISGATSATYDANTPGVYKVEFIDANGCKRMSSNFINLSLIQKPTPLFSYDLNCINTRTFLTNQSNSALSGSVSYLWRFQDGTTSDSFNVSHVFPTSGVYKVTLIVTPTACPQLADSLPTNILVQTPAKGINYESINALIGKPVGLIARQIGDQYKWSPAEGLNNTIVRIPILNPTKDAKYTVSITNAAGCITTDTIKINIFDEQDVFIAGAFTPNRDGKNDRIYPILVAVDVFVSLRIYNRWGNLVYSSNAIDPNLGWDGTYRGKDQPADTYTWVAEAIGLNGKSIRKSGSLVLIR